MLPLTESDGRYVLQTRLLPGTVIRYQFYASLPASPETALIPVDCLDSDGNVSVTITEDSVVVSQTNISCPSLSRN
jgi:hypothetical protein